MNHRPYKPRRASKRWLEGAPEYVLDCFDTGWCDRYAILFGGRLFDDNLLKDRKILFLGLSDNPEHPAFGYSMWGECDAAWRPSKWRVRWLDLPENVRNHIVKRVEGAYLLAD